VFAGVLEDFLYCLSQLAPAAHEPPCLRNLRPDAAAVLMRLLRAAKDNLFRTHYVIVCLSLLPGLAGRQDVDLPNEYPSSVAVMLAEGILPVCSLL
jgi:hypothetical protein